MSRSLHILSILLLFSSAACKREVPAELGVVVQAVPTAGATPIVLKKGDHVVRTAGLTFTAKNDSPTPSWLMLFIVDAQQRIFWLIPSANPGAESMPLPNNRPPVQAGPVTLGDAAQGPCQIMALFSDRALPALGVNEQVRVGGYQAVRAIDGATVVQTYPLVLD